MGLPNYPFTLLDHPLGSKTHSEVKALAQSPTSKAFLSCWRTNDYMPAYPEELKVEHHSNGVVVATLNRPDVLNAFNGALRIGIKELVTEVKQDSSVRALC